MTESILRCKHLAVLCYQTCLKDALAVKGVWDCAVADNVRQPIGIESMRVGLAVLESARTGEKIYLDAE